MPAQGFCIMKENQLDILWEKYISQDISDEELLLLMELVKDRGNERDLYLMVSREFEQRDSTLLPMPSSMTADAVLGKANGLGAPRSQVAHIQKNRWKWVAAAAVLLLVTISAVYKYALYPAMDKGERVVMSNGTDPETLHALKTLSGPLNVALPDGSVVYLKENATLQYDTLKFGLDAYRDVLLSGEAFFDVKHLEQQPFIVHTQAITTTVLGTSFDIVADDRNISVTVLTGRVGVHQGEKSLAILESNRQINIPVKATSDARVKSVNAEEGIEWISHFMILDDISLQEVATILEKRFGTEVNVEKGISNRHVTAKFYNDEKLGGILDVVCMVLGVQWKRVNDAVYISAKG